MAIETRFKQQCPSCEAMVPVKDIGMVGKKIECPKCKDKFIVKSPAKKKNTDDDDEDAPLKPTGKAAPGKKPVRRDEDDEELDELDDVEELDEDELRNPAAKTKKKKGKGDEDDDEDAKVSGKKKTGASRFSVGIALAVVGLIVLGAAAFFITRPRSSNLPAIAKGNKGIVPPDGTAPDDKGQTEKKDVPEEPVKPQKVDIPLNAANAELTNLLPNDTDHVAHVSVRYLLDPAGPWRDVLFQTPGGLKDDFLRTRLGFSLLAIDDLLRADHYGTGGWSFTVVHFQEIVDQAAVKKALDLKPAPLVKNYTYYQVSSPNRWLEPLTRLTLGVPRSLVPAPKNDKRVLYVHFHNPQTLIFADEAPMVALLKEDKRFKSLTDPPATPPPSTDPNQPAPNPKDPPTPAPATNAPKDGQGDTANPPPATPLRLETYMTIKPVLKAVMDRMELPALNSVEKILFSSATDLNAAELADVGDEVKGKGLWSPRQVWDVTLLLQDRNPRLRCLGTAVVQKDSRFFELRNELGCPEFTQAESLQKELAEEIAPDVARFIDLLLAHKVDVSKREEPMPADPGNPAAPQPKDLKETKDEPATSRITVTHKEKAVEFILDLKLEQPEMGKLQNIAALLGSGLSAAMDLAAGTTSRHYLARAGKLLPEKGLSDRGVLPGNYPPGAFPRPLNNSKRFSREPRHRVSWMAGLLPFLGQESLYGKINFNDSWRDPSNWFPALTIVPQFLDPTYPASSYYVTRPDLPLELAATHFVGIAGVGLDAADYDPADPANVAKCGVMGYEKGLSLEDVRQGHGLGNTILMLQVPPDGIPGVTPWIAGGGSTLRGVPDKNSVAPFVFSSPGKDGKPRRGTYAVMADSSVRFIDQSVSDEVFKAMATARSPLPEGFDPDGFDSKVQLIKAPKGFGLKDAPAPNKGVESAPMPAIEGPPKTSQK